MTESTRHQVIRGILALWIAGPVGASAAASQGVQVEVRTIDGAVLSGRYAGIGQDDALRFDVNGATQSVRLDEVERIIFDTRPGLSVTSADDAVFHLADGGRFAGRIVAATDDGIDVRTAFAESVTLKFEHLAAIRFPADPDPPRARQVFEAELAARLPGKDVLVTRAGDQVKTVRGTILSLGPTSGRFLLDGRERTFDVSSVYGLVCALGAGSREPAPARLHLASGALLPARLLPSDGDRIIAQAAFGSRLELPPDGVVEIALHSDRVVYLSDIEPVGQDVRGLLHAPWPVRRDASATNNPIRLDGRTFGKGLGVHARAQLVYALDGGFERFCATVGIDDAVRPRGNVVFRVLGDGRVFFDSGPVTGREPARDLNIEVTGVNELTLLVDYGEGMDLADHADWADARIIHPADRPRDPSQDRPEP